MTAKYAVLSEYFVYTKRRKYAGETNTYPGTEKREGKGFPAA